MTHDPDDRTLDTSGPVAGELRERRPLVDPVQAEVARARAERALFGAATPARVGRFSLLGPVAAGGMGVVYTAYDPQLDRRVALKLLHPEAPRSEVARERLLIEARALARLDHPNVVPVHDAVTVDDQVVVVMEWVDGKSLASWEGERARSWHEVVAVYRGAGRGLAAAHALGLVHRDFKPANAIIGDDGRVRVLDFGLARMADAADASAARADAAPGDTLTETGELLGTLAYMAPEQLAGEPATAASDQFSFCVALYRALYGVAPFAGTTAERLRESMAAGELIEPAERRRAPGWLRAVVTRGLAVAPAERHPSMTALLDQLERERGWRRWRVPIAITAAIGGGLLAARMMSGPAGPSCERGPLELEAIWDAPRRAVLRGAFDRASTSSAADAGARVAQGFDDYRARWLAMHRAACVDHRDGVQSDAVLDRRMMCLRRRKDALRAAIDVLGGVDRRSIGRAREVVAGLPPIDDCGDLDLLAAELDPPAHVETRARVAALEARLAAAVALERLGRSSDALRLVQQVVSEARAVGYAPLQADSLLAEGRILLFREDRAQARGPLAAAEELSFEHGMLARGVVAAARRIYVDAMRGDDLPGLVRQAAVIEPLSRGLRDGFARPLLLNNVGVLHMALEQREQARAAFAQARVALAGVRQPDLELTTIDRNLAMLTSDGDQRAALARSVWERRRAALGDAHLSTLEALLSYAKYLSDPGAALPVVRESCARYREQYSELRGPRVECHAYEAFVTSELGDLRGAASSSDEVVAVLAGDASANARIARLLATGHAARYRGDDRAARAAFAEVLAAATGDAWWLREAAAHAHLGIGQGWSTFEPPRAALEHLERALATYEQLDKLNEESESKQRLALARVTLAAALRHHGGAAPRVAELERMAAEFYRAAGPESYANRLASLTR